MTTIIYDHSKQLIACDSRICAGSMILSDNDSKWLKIDNSVWFFSGSTADEQRLVDYFNAESPEKPVHSIEASAIVVGSDGSVNRYSVDEGTGEPIRVPIKYNDGIGSGYIYALCAIDFGLDVSDAVKYAMKRDSATGGDVLVFDINKMAFL